MCKLRGNRAADGGLNGIAGAARVYLVREGAARRGQCDVAGTGEFTENERSGVGCTACAGSSFSDQDCEPPAEKL